MQHTRKAFTLLELIVVIVILGILAALAIPTFQSVIGKSKDASTKTTLAAVTRDARALYALGGTTYDQAMATAIGETAKASAPGAYAAGTLSASNDLTVVPAVGTIAYGTLAGHVRLAASSGAGDLCLVDATTAQNGTPWCVDGTQAAATSPAQQVAPAASAVVPDPALSAPAPTTPTTPTKPAPVNQDPSSVPMLPASVTPGQHLNLTDGGNMLNADLAASYWYIPATDSTVPLSSDSSVPNSYTLVTTVPALPSGSASLVLRNLAGPSASVTSTTVN